MDNRNNNVDIICSKCGGKELVPSYIRFTACYGSKYDTETLELPLCADCFDKIYENFIVGSDDKKVVQSFEPDLKRMVVKETNGIVNALNKVVKSAVEYDKAVQRVGFHRTKKLDFNGRNK